jgi:transcriptional regulator of heat shock response
MDKRQEKILHAVIHEYIRHGDPIGSRLLYEEYDFDVSPALIRAELHELMEAGYLSQPHTSGGRVPTDKGYRDYVEAVCEDVAEMDSMPDSMKRFESLCRGAIGESFKETVSLMSHAANALGVGYEFDPVTVYKQGFNTLFEQIEGASHEDLSRIVDDFENLDVRIDKVAAALDPAEESAQVYIGKQSPVTKSDQLAVLMRGYQLPDGRRIAVSIVGPKRMNYRRNLTLLKLLSLAIQNSDE